MTLYMAAWVLELHTGLFGRVIRLPSIRAPLTLGTNYPTSLDAG